MIKISFEKEFKRLEKDLNKIHKEVFPRAIPQAINRVGATVLSRVTKSISHETKLQQKVIRFRVRRDTFRASRRRPFFIINFRKVKATNLIETVAKGRKNSKFFRKRTKKGFKWKGVQANAWGKKKIYDGTFIGRGRGSGKLLVFKRDGKRLEAVKGPSPRDVFERSENISLMRKATFERMPIELDRAIRRHLGRIL